MNPALSFRFLSLPSIGLVGLMACSLQPEDDRAVAQVERAFYSSNSSIWPERNISVCWATTNYAPEREWVRTAVEEAFEADSLVDFTGWRDCASVGGAAEVVVDFNSSSSVTVVAGKREPLSSPNIVLNPFTGSNPVPGSAHCFGATGLLPYIGKTGRTWPSGHQACIESTAVHSFFRVLGVLPEHDRPDAPTLSSCSPTPNGPTGTTYSYWDPTALTNGCNPAWFGDGLLSPLDVSGLTAHYGTREDDHLWWGAGNAKEYGSAGSGIPDQLMFDSDAEHFEGTYIPVVGDFDGDGRDDVYLYGSGTLPDYNRWGRADRTFDSASHREVNGVYMPVAGDFNGDGESDIFLYQPGSGTDYLLSGATTRAFASQSDPFPLDNNATYVPVAGDFDGNGRDDIFFYNPGGSEKLFWSESNGTFTNLVPSQLQLSTTDYRPIVGNFDGDDFDDVFLYLPGSGTDAMRWGKADRTFGTGSAPQVSGAYDVAVGKFDDNGTSDIIWSRSGIQDNAWLFDTTRGTYRSHVLSRVQAGIPFAGDFDGDGRSDVFWYAAGSPEMPRFVHPGVLNSQEQLDAIYDRNNASPADSTNQLIKDAYQAMINMSLETTTSDFRKDLYTGPSGWWPFEDPPLAPQPFATPRINEQLNGLDNLEADAPSRDSQAAYYFALKWVAAGQAEDAERALDFMNSWSSAFQALSYDASGFGGGAAEADRHLWLEAAWLASTWAASGELLRHHQGGYPGWGDSEIADFEQMVQTLVDQARPAIDPTVHHMSNNNRGLAAAYAFIAAGVFLEDEPLFDHGIAKWEQILPAVISDDGTFAEFSERKDCHHAQYSFLALSHSAEVAWHQGVDLYSYRIGTESRSRLELGMKRFGMILRGSPAATNLAPDPSDGDPATCDDIATWTLYCSCDGIIKSNSLPSGNIACPVAPDPDGWEVAYNHYKYRAAASLNVNLEAYELALNDAACDEMTPEVKDRLMFPTWSSLSHGFRPIPVPPN